VKQTLPSILDISAVGGASLRARACTSTEGVHVTGRRGSQLVSDLYLGLRHELEQSTCRGEDLK
jgi:hypothetical protein